LDCNAVAAAAHGGPRLGWGRFSTNKRFEKHFNNKQNLFAVGLFPPPRLRFNSNAD
jgi:hypothetical protein